MIKMGFNMMNNKVVKLFWRQMDKETNSGVKVWLLKTHTPTLLGFITTSAVFKIPEKQYYFKAPALFICKIAAVSEDIIIFCDM